MYKFHFIDHTADIAAELEATSFSELFLAAAEVWEMSVTETNNFIVNDSKNIKLKSDSLEELLVDFLSEINFLFLTKKWLCISVPRLNINSNEGYEIDAELNGCDISDSSIIFKEEIKAITYHQLKIEKNNELYRTRIVFDI